jgi:hypothetical protein
MHWHDLAPDHGVLELLVSPLTDRGPDLELLIWWGGGEKTRAAWVWSPTGRVAGWALVGVA